MAGLIMLSRVNALLIFVGCYSEQDQGPSYCGPNARFEGGLLGSGVIVAAGGAQTYGNTHRGGLNVLASQPAIDAGDNVSVRIHSSANSMYMFAKGSGAGEGLPYDWSWLPFGFFAWQYAGGSNYAYGITDDTGLYTAGRPGPAPIPPNRLILPEGMWLGGRLAASGSRKIDLGFDAPTEGAFAQGERRFTSTPTPGGIDGWVCTQTGFMGYVWAAGNVYFPPAYANAGNWYRMANQYGATSADPPVHTSGTVTGADGMAWEYLGTGDAVWKTFGLVGALERVEELEGMIGGSRARVEALEAAP